MSSESAAANWAVAKRLVHWGIAIAVVTALVAPKPEDGDGLLHIAAGTTALALVIARLCWRVFGGVRPFFRDALRLRWPDFSRGARGLAPFLLQVARLVGFVFLAAIPTAVALAVTGLGQGEDSPLLEAHEAMGKTIMVLAIVHAAFVVMFALLIKYHLLSITLTGGARAFGEGGVRGLVGLGLGAALGAAALAYAWGPFDIAAKAAALEQSEHGDGGDEDD